jgi:hypothetical protein
MIIAEFLFCGFFVFLQRAASIPIGDSILLEDGSYLLQENGDRILLE